MTISSPCNHEYHLWTLFKLHSKPLGAVTSGAHHGRYLTEDGFRAIVDSLVGMGLLDGGHVAEREGTESRSDKSVGAVVLYGEVEIATVPSTSPRANASTESAGVSGEDALERVDISLSMDSAPICSLPHPNVVISEVVPPVRLQSETKSFGDTIVPDAESHATAELPASPWQVDKAEPEGSGWKQGMEPREDTVHRGVHGMRMPSDNGNRHQLPENMTERSKEQVQNTDVRRRLVDSYVSGDSRQSQKCVQWTRRGGAVYPNNHLRSGVEGETSSFNGTGLDAVISLVKSDKTSCFSDMALDSAALDQLLPRSVENDALDKANDNMFVMIEEAAAQQDSLHGFSRVKFFPAENTANRPDIRNRGPRLSTPPRRPRNPAVILPSPHVSITDERYKRPGASPRPSQSSFRSPRLSPNNRGSSVRFHPSTSFQTPVGRHGGEGTGDGLAAAATKTGTRGAAFVGPRASMDEERTALSEDVNTDERRQVQQLMPRRSINTSGSGSCGYTSRGSEGFPQPPGRRMVGGVTSLESAQPRHLPRNAVGSTQDGMGMGSAVALPQYRRKALLTSDATSADHTFGEWSSLSPQGVMHHGACAPFRGSNTNSSLSGGQGSGTMTSDPRRFVARPAVGPTAPLPLLLGPRGRRRSASVPCCPHGTEPSPRPPRSLSKRARLRAERKWRPMEPPAVPHTRARSWGFRAGGNVTAPLIPTWE
ncbi:hypothetical protein, conserved [Trypanosoma brucei brucei TREU927]|uniref:Uncharacterized protein n=1 Tax=Trypanosoma brucei brucei (strain 927/4 GUTat10.1) TaxID=185431 RepID=Q389F4_TRYB2|nr:hypothetical protein, conserved [Trypanosoma brucei brucei TREU927]EAN78566.1 hypothetical protein, conserved [Trypanosoma brucei brucei TREU927]